MLLIIAIIILLLLLNIIIYISLNYSFIESFPQDLSIPLKSFSIIIAAKNEEKNISKLLESLINQNYPKDKYEVIIVDDNSTDNTRNVVNLYVNKFENIRLFNCKKKDLPAKKGVLAFGVSKAVHPNILITDADCECLPNWIASYSGLGEKYSVAFGIAPFIRKKSFVNLIACFENFRAGILSISAAYIGSPYTATARNFGYTREIYNRVDGYKNTADTISGDDDLFVREAGKVNSKIGFIYDSNGFVLSFTKTNIIDYLRQKARHTSTSNYYLLKHLIMLGLWHITNLFALLISVFSFVSIIYLFPILIKIFLDIIIVKKFSKYYNYNFSFFEIILIQITYEVFLIVHYLNSFFLGKKWK